MKEIVTVMGQSLADIALQEYGAVEGTMALLIDNEFIGDASYVFEEKTVVNIREEKLALNADSETIRRMMVEENVGRIIGGLDPRVIDNKDYLEDDYVDVNYVLEL